MEIENPRLRLVLGRQWKLLVVVLGIVALAAFGGAAATYQDQPTESRTLETNQQTVVTNTSDRATVVGNDSLWAKGTVLEDKPVYIVNDTPVVETRATTRVQGAEEARINHVWRVIIRVQTGEEEFYSESRVLSNETRQGTTVTTGTEIDIPELTRRVANVSEKARGAGAVTVTLSLDVNYETNPGGDGYAGNETYAAPLELGGETFAVAGDIGGERSHSTSRTTQVTQPRDWGTIGSLGFVGLFALALAGAVVSLDPREIDVDQARVDMHRTQYEEWISPGVIPMGISQQFVELETIEDVVDVAIDTNERVVYDRRRDLYAVISENLVYYFSTGGSWMESAFGQMSMPGGGGGGGFDDDSPFGGGGGGFGGGGPSAGPGGPEDGDAFGFPEESETPFGDGGDEPFPPGDSPDAADTPFDGGDDGPFDGPRAASTHFEEDVAGDAGDPFGDAEDAADDPFGDAEDGDGGPFGGDADAADDPFSGAGDDDGGPFSDVEDDDGGPFEDADDADGDGAGETDAGDDDAG